MNKIYWDRDKISIITDQIESVPHKHWTMQLFLSIEKNLEIGVEDNKISCRCIVINRDILHSFSTGNNMYFTSSIVIGMHNTFLFCSIKFPFVGKLQKVKNRNFIRRG